MGSDLARGVGVRAVDLFAGAGGMSTGARDGGAAIAFAANHWRVAVDVHEHHHPDAEHACPLIGNAVPPVMATRSAPGSTRHRKRTRPGWCTSTQAGGKIDVTNHDG